MTKAKKATKPKTTRVRGIAGTMTVEGKTLTKASCHESKENAEAAKKRHKANGKTVRTKTDASTGKTCVYTD
ncbi:MAG: hypothetical protein RLZZ628_2884 [Bacteroidota bacterium]